MLLTALLVFLASYALVWAVTSLGQAYVYERVVDRLPLRAAGAAAVVALYVMMWVAIDRGSPGKYDTFFEFASYTTAQFNEFEAVRWEPDPATRNGKVEFKKDAAGKPAETTVKFRRAGGKSSKLVDDKGREFVLSDGGMMTAAIVFKPDPAGAPVRFDALFKDGPRGKEYFPKSGSDTERRRFVDPTGPRYVSLDQPGVMVIPSTGTVFFALLLNFGLFVAWFAAFWPVLRFGAGFALLLAVAFGLVTMIAIMPVLFKPGRAAPPPAEARLPLPPPLAIPA